MCLLPTYLADRHSCSTLVPTMLPHAIDTRPRGVTGSSIDAAVVVAAAVAAGVAWRWGRPNERAHKRRQQRVVSVPVTLFCPSREFRCVDSRTINGQFYAKDMRSSSRCFGSTSRPKMRSGRTFLIATCSPS